MKKVLLICLGTLFLTMNSNARGIPMPFCLDCEYIDVVEELPDTEEFYAEEYKAYVDLSYAYSQFWVLWVPLWNSNGRYCYKVKGQDIYYDISAEELKAIEKEFGFNLSSNPISFWNKFGGKLILILIIGGAIWWQFRPKEAEPVTEPVNEAEPEPEPEAEADTDK